MSIKAAIFDIYGTLITAKNGTRSNKTNNFVFLGQERIMEFLNSLRKNKYQIYLISDEETSHRIKMLQSIFYKELRWVPKFIKLEKLLTISLNKNSFYCGDDIGSKDLYPPYTLSDKDTQIAKSLKIKLIRPIDLFGTHIPFPRHYQELIVTVGNTGSMKSTIAYQIMEEAKLDEGPVYVDCDTDKMPNYDRKETLNCVRQNLLKGNSVIAIATNASENKRQDFISIAKELNIPVRVLWFIRDGRPFNSLRNEKQTLPSTYLHSKPVKSGVYLHYTTDFESLNDKEYEVEIVY
jgi:hypothetical protein